MTRAYVTIALVSWLLVSGWMFADLNTPSYSWGGSPGRRETRNNSGVAVLIGSLLAAGWPLGVPFAFLLTGYADDGWRAPWELSSWEDER